MKSGVTTNVLLMVIAACLVLIAGRMYTDRPMVAAAEAQPQPAGVQIYGCHRVMTYNCEWIAVQVDKNGVVQTGR